MFTYEIWDGKSPINDVSAKEIKKIYNITNGVAYIVYAPDGKVQIFQPQKPDKEGYEPMTEQEAIAYAKAQVEELNLHIPVEPIDLGEVDNN